MNDSFPPNRQQQLDETRQRLTQLEAETHRLRAQLARLEAAGEDAAAAKLEAEIARRTQQFQSSSPASQTTVVESDDLTLSDNLLGDALTPVQPTPARQPAVVDQPDQAEPETAPELAEFSIAKESKSGETPLAVESVPELSNSKEERLGGKRKRSWVALIGDSPAWATSLGVHVLLILLFSLVTIVTLTDNPPMLLASAFDGDDEFTDEFAEIDLTPLEIEEMPLDEMELEPTDVTEVSLSELDVPWDSAAEGMTDLAPGLAASLPTDMASLMVGESGGQAEGSGKTGDRPNGGGKPGSTQFFGAKSKGNRFVFVIDNSGSMQDGRLETTMLELQQAVGAMSAEQMFYVIFYSDQAYPMFFPASVDKMQPATRDNKKKLGEWLFTVQMCVGGKLKDAMEMAAELEPNVVYLLSDGSIGSKRTMEFLTADNGWQFTVHTLGMTVRDAEDAGNLVAIAQANRGGFKMVGISPQAAQMSRRRPIPYHNKGPGPVWGTKVAVRR